MGEWKYGLLHPKFCLADWKLCLMAYIAPPHVWGMSIEKLSSDHGDGIRCATLSYIPILQWFVMPFWRKFVRETTGVSGNIFFDCLAVYCCPCCSIFQAGNEAGVDAEYEISRLVRLVTNSVSGFSPKDELNKAKPKLSADRDETSRLNDDMARD